LNWLAPQAFSLALVYVHPLVALWFLDRQLRRTRPGWSRAYRVCLALLPLALAVLWWRLAASQPLADDGEVAFRIVRHAGAGVLAGVSTHLLVSTHVFLETLHYGVWLVGVPLAAGTGLLPWRAGGVPLVRHRRGWPRLIRALLAACAFAVVLLWACFLADYATTRDVYFTVAVTHVLAEVPFLLRTM
jgi:predicted outer membrane lipoprotein